jgi:HSP20 family protein
MTLRRRYSIFDELLRLQKELENLLQPIAAEVRPAETEKVVQLTMPLEVYETDNEFVVKAELPGVKKEDVDVVVRENYLIIRAEKKEEHKEEKQNVYVSERIYGKVERVIPLPPDADVENIKASFKDGVLEIRIPKKATTKEKKITIE